MEMDNASLNQWVSRAMLIVQVYLLVRLAVVQVSW